MAPPVLKTSLFPAENQRLSSVDDIEHCPTLDDPEGIELPVENVFVSMDKLSAIIIPFKCNF